MERFYTQIKKFDQLAEQEDYYAALAAGQEAFEILLYSDDEPVVVEPPLIGAIDRLQRFIGQLVQLPEIEENEYIQEVLSEIKAELSAYIADESEAEDLGMAIVELARLTHYLKGAADYLKMENLPLGQNADPKLIIAVQEDGSMQLYGRMAEDGLSPEEAQAMMQRFQQLLSPDAQESDLSQLLNLAAQLMVKGALEEAKQAYWQIQEQYPSYQAQCQTGLGACAYYQENFEQAIEHYFLALKAGESEDRCAYNVSESCQALIFATNDRNEKMKWVYFFKEHFPEIDQQFELD